MEVLGMGTRRKSTEVVGGGSSANFNSAHSVARDIEYCDLLESSIFEVLGNKPEAAPAPEKEHSAFEQTLRTAPMPSTRSRTTASTPKGWEVGPSGSLIRARTPSPAVGTLPAGGMLARARATTRSI